MTAALMLAVAPDGGRSVTESAGPGMPGDAVLPAMLGPRTTFNAQGKYKIMPKLGFHTAHQVVLWRWTEWRGRHDRVEREEYRDRKYRRQAREFIKPTL